MDNPDTQIDMTQNGQSRYTGNIGNMTQNGQSRYTGNIENMTQNDTPDTQTTLRT